jgi:hypothetical protein
MSGYRAGRMSAEGEKMKNPPQAPPPGGATIPSIAGQFKNHLQASHDFIDL